MKKGILLGCVLFVAIAGTAQTPMEYFPQEQLVHPTLPKEKDPSVYLHKVVEQKLVAFLSQKKQISTLKKYRKDTVNIALGFVVDPKGMVRPEKNEFNCNQYKLVEKWDKDMKTILSSLPQFKILNRKPAPHISTHYLRYRFVLHGKKNPVLESVPSLGSYKGGVIREIPVFPGCENLSQEETAQCFQQMMEQHIVTHFSYPSDALQNNIFGTVKVAMDITEKGAVENMRVVGKSPHGSLRREAFRIMGLLPKLQPNKINGEPTEVTFSIPVIFKL